MEPSSTALKSTASVETPNAALESTGSMETATPMDARARSAAHAEGKSGTGIGVKRDSKRNGTETHHCFFHFASPC
ncbi:hypothetical protein P3T43_000619 [Paraburkholderia sp. GAS41]|jgi:hypothetical protein|uniref:hypothetical protein n=1 Tax=Paraburkholderia sp. GAS41 TaxID=3035134 RepID=UPI003D2321DE